MAAGFKLKNISSSTTSIGDTLKRARVRRKISIVDAEEATKIRAKFLLALECDSWDQIPSAVYGRGFLERYAEFLQVPGEKIMAQYDRERQLYGRHHLDAAQTFAPAGTLTINRPPITARSLLIVFSACLILGVAGSVAYQVYRFTGAPYLQLATPAEAKAQDNMLVVQVNSIEISGRTANDSLLTVNGNPTAVSGDGTFKAPVVLDKGVNAVTVQSTNPKGKSTSEILSFVLK